MCVVSQSICIIAGNDFFFDLQYLESDAETPIDLTGSTAIMQLLEQTDSLTDFIQMQGGIVDAENGLMRFFLDDIETQSLLPIAEGNIAKTYVSDIQLTYTDTTKEVILRADAKVEQGRVRP